MSIIFLPLLLLCIGIFAGFEVGFYVINPIRLDILAEKKDRNAQLLKWFKNHKEQLITSILIGTNMFNYLFSGLLVMSLKSVDKEYRVLLSTLIGTICVFLFAEVYPKFLFQSYPDRLTYSFTKIIYVFHTILLPVSYLFKVIIRIISKYLKVKKSPMDYLYGRKSLIGFIDQAHSLKIIDKSKKEMLYAILKLKDYRVSSAMIKKEDIISFYSDEKIESVLAIVKKTPYKRYPVLERKSGKAFKILNSLALFWNEEDYHFLSDMNDELINPIFIEEKTSQLSAMQLMQLNNSVMAIVTRKGVYTGIITLRDIINNSITRIKDL